MERKSLIEKYLEFIPCPPGEQYQLISDELEAIRALYDARLQAQQMEIDHMKAMLQATIDVVVVLLKNLH